MTDSPPQGRPEEELPVDPDGPEASPGPAPRRAAHLLRERGDILLVIAAGGAVGSLGRWSVTEAVPSDPWRMPWGTWIENVSGAFALGVLMVFVLDVWPPRRYLRPFLGVGVLGGYTTFSTYMLDTRTLLDDGHAISAALYLLGTMVTGLLAVAVGVLLARLTVRLTERRHRRRRERDDHDPATDLDPNIDPDPDLDPDIDADRTGSDSNPRSIR